MRASAFMAQPAVARSLPLIGLIGLIAAAAALWLILREPPQRDLFRNLADGDKAAIVEVLGKNNIPYELDRTTGSLTVSEDNYFKAKMMLASQGLPKSAPDGNSMIDSLPLGASRAVEGEKLRSAREMDLARTIEAIDAVQSARVHLAVEQPSIFLRERTKPSASVMLTLADGRALEDQQVQAIVHLVGSSVPDLDPDAISVVDQNGRLLSKTGSSQSDQQLGIQAQIEERYRQQIIALLTPVLGAGKFSTEVHTEVNFAERQATRETYPQDEARLRVEQGSWQASNPNGRPGEAGGIPGALSNQVPAAAVPATTQAGAVQAAQGTQPAQGATPTDATPPAAPQRTQETYNRSFELGREVSVTRDAVGTVRRVSVAVAIDYANGKPRTGAEMAAIEQLVKGAVGFDANRGDVVALSTRNFIKPQAEPTPWYETEWAATLGRNASALVVALVLLFGVGRPLLKRRAALAEEAALDRAAKRQRIGREISGELARNGAVGGGSRVTLDMINSAHDYAQRADLIRDFVKQDPDRAALVVRDLLKEGKPRNG